MNTSDVSRACRGPLSPAPIYPLAFRSTSLNLHGLPAAAPHRRNAALIQAFAIPIALVIPSAGIASITGKRSAVPDADSRAGLPRSSAGPALRSSSSRPDRQV